MVPTSHCLELSGIYDPLFSKYSLVLGLLENGRSLNDTEQKWQCNKEKVKEKGNDCLREGIQFSCV